VVTAHGPKTRHYMSCSIVMLQQFTGRTTLGLFIKYNFVDIVVQVTHAERGRK
jgi:hypothetical protein